MATEKEDALNEILALAEEHGIMAIVINDEAENIEVCAPHSLAVTGKLRGRTIPGSSRLSQRTLHLEISFRETSAWVSTAGLDRQRYWN